MLTDAGPLPLPLGQIAGSVEQIAWAQDGASLLVLAADPGLDTASAHNATTIRGEHSGGDDPLVIRPVSAWRRLMLVDRATGATTPVEFEGLTVWEFDWDGASTLAVVVSADSSESGWYTAHVRVCDLSAPHRTLARIDSEWQLALPRLAPGGAGVAFLEGVCSDRGISPASPCGPRSTAGRPGPSTRGVDLDCTWLQWRDDHSLWCTGWRGIGSACGMLALDGGFTEVWAGAATLGSRLQARVSADRGGTRLVAVCEAANRPPEAVQLDPAAPQPDWSPLTALNAELAVHALPEWSRLEWSSTDGRAIDGLIALPPTGRRTICRWWC